MWYQRFDPPASKTAARAAKNTARAVDIHLKNIAEIEAGRPAIHFYDVAQSTQYVEDAVRMAYQFPNLSDRIEVETKPVAPAVCVWDVMSSASRAKVRAMDLAPE